MKRTRIKICGITNSRDAEFAVACEVDALGFNLYKKSPRCIDAIAANSIIEQLPPFVISVGLFVNHPADEVRHAISESSFDLLQFHGDETDDYCMSFGKPFIKAIRLKVPSELEMQVSAFPHARGVLLDAYVEGEYGGTGESIDWADIPDTNIPVVLAGGLNVINVGLAIEQVAPFAVDVSSGVESEKGVKDHKKIARFVQAVRKADSEASNDK
ncbi:MAG: phosphoribosylanthranilate isomerase [Gammaproteobacteria bacterium]|nr:phosphoribosylanthranilate isomerase [Gammaproteobacteria bacterium]|tara:strand:+ start:1927 stop:2568 length:642 start_codon:yes stop_codon:yes gene_type:complete